MAAVLLVSCCCTGDVVRAAIDALLETLGGPSDDTEVRGLRGGLSLLGSREEGDGSRDEDGADDC